MALTPDRIVKVGSLAAEFTDSRGTDTGAGPVTWDAPTRSSWAESVSQTAGPAGQVGVSSVWADAYGFFHVTYPNGAAEWLGYEAVAQHVLEPNPHPQYLRRSALPLTVDLGGTGADLSGTGPGLVVQPSMGAPLDVVDPSAFLRGAVLGTLWVPTLEAVPGTTPTPTAMPTPDAITFDLPAGGDVVVEWDSMFQAGANNQNVVLDVDVDGTLTGNTQLIRMTLATGSNARLRTVLVCTGLSAGTHTLTSMIGGPAVAPPNLAWRYMRVSTA